MSDVYRVTCLTPVHIGSGRELFREVDFFPKGRETIVLDPDRVIALGESIPGLAEAIVKRDTARWIEGSRVDVSVLAAAVVPGRLEAQRLRASMRTGDGRPLIPGSSVKGALRTLLLTAWVAEGPPHGPRNAVGAAALAQALERGRARPLEEALFLSPQRREPQGDVLRLLRVSDAVFPPEAIRIVSSKAVGTTRMTLTSAESLQPAAAAVTRITVDRSKIYTPLAFPAALPAWAELARWSRIHALHLLTEDERYFAKEGAEGPRDRCAQLVADIKAMNTDTLVLRLGWGTGWRTMTGDILSASERGRLRMRVGKTRKVILKGHERGGEPEDVFGWIRLDPVAPAEARTLYVSPLPPVSRPPARPAGDKTGVASSARSVASEPVEDPFVTRLRTFAAKERGQLDQLLEQVARRPDADACTKILGTRVGEVFAGDKRQLKALREKYGSLAPYLVKA